MCSALGAFLYDCPAMMNNYPEYVPEEESDVLEQVALAAKVILYNDEDHTFDEVITQIIRATGCSADTAHSLTLEVHHRGKAMVFEGPLEGCLRVSAILEEISLHTQIEW